MVDYLCFGRDRQAPVLQAAVLYGLVLCLENFQLLHSDGCLFPGEGGLLPLAVQTLLIQHRLP